MADSKKKRNKKCKPPGVNSRGERRGARPIRLTELQKALAGKGIVQALQPIAVKAPWRGVRDLNGSAPYDAAQVAENRKLYPHLFMDQ